jgi:hypothetical protein
MKNPNKRNNAVIAALILSAMALSAVIFFVNPAPAPADFAVKDRDYQFVTASVQNGSDGLYILDNRSGLIAVFLYEPGKGLVHKGTEPIADAFGNGGGIK